MSGEDIQKRGGGSTSPGCGTVALLCAPGGLHAILFSIFAFRAHALYGDWPPVYHFYQEMQPWTRIFEYWQGVLWCAVCGTGVLVLLMAIPVACGWRRFALPTILCALFIFTVASFLGLVLPMVLLPQGAVDWWYD